MTDTPPHTISIALPAVLVRFIGKKGFDPIPLLQSAGIDPSALTNPETRLTADQFETLYAYSPYHNLAEQEYPAVLVTTADHDDRVVPGHSFKYAARLQAVQQGDQPVLIRIESKAGHGAGKPTAKRIEEAADIYAFLAWSLGMDAEPGL